jgi:hypothetical protein
VEAVAAALKAIDSRLTLGGADADLHVELYDEGARFRVVAGTVVREFTGDTERCDERARKAAVFIALVFRPPTIELPPPRPPAAWRRLLVDLELSAVGLGAPGASADGVGGAELRLFVGTRYFGASLGVQGLSPTVLQLAAARARLDRVPVDLSLRGAVGRGRLTGSAEAGLMLAALISRGLEVPLSIETSRLEVGVRLALGAELRLRRRIALHAAALAEVVPRPYSLVLPTLGVVGKTPGLWLGGGVGVSVRLR